MNKKKLALMQSVIALLLCISMLVSTTFAWFTDSVQTGINTIASGVLDVELYHSNSAVENEKVDSTTELFKDLSGKDILWEPGVISYENLRVSNEGDLALAYQLSIVTANENYIVAESGAQYGLSQILKVGIVEGGIQTNDRAAVIASVPDGGWKSLSDFMIGDSLMSEGNGESQQTVGVVIYWQPGENEFDNLYNLNNGKQLNEGDVLNIELGVKLVATQEVYESDAFGNDYDTDAKADVFPDFVGGTASATVVPNDQNQTTADVSMVSGQVSATVPAGVQVAEGTTELTMTVTEMSATGSNITLSDGEEIRSLDVHIEGVAVDNTTPITVVLREAAPVGLNMGNYKLYHVENGVTNEMTLVASDADFTAHNQFKYDPATGDITLYMATFSEVAMVADTENAWNGTLDYSWYDAVKTEFVIANADQLAGFGAIVGGMAKTVADKNGNTVETEDDFSGDTVNLIADINLGDQDNANTGLIFYPIGYYNSTGSYEKISGGSVTSNVNSFEGTFDGKGHTIANFYQNTWEMFGDYNSGYTGTPNHYKDAMGLFGYVHNGTVKNLTVDHFSSDGEFTPTGVIAAYADGEATFENIAITNCNPRVYNTGNGGIIGVAGSSSGGDKITLSNITVDNSNKISALWGSWDVACGGLVGMFRGNDNGSTISFTNCHVAAQIDVYNDVCANYQYYAYRYAGMIIGSVRSNTTSDEGKSIPNMTGISATGCTVNFGTWNDYYYCELVDNTTASYTHDYQMSRLTEIKSIDGTTITYLDGTTDTVPTSGRANYVIVDYTEGHGTENATCYHFKDGQVWEHENGGYEEKDINGDGVVDSDVLKEDKQHLYLEFSNLFTGYGWGVSSMGIDKWNGITALGVTTGTQEESVEKFETKTNVIALEAGKEYTLGTLFAAKSDVTIVDSAVTVGITNLDENGNVTVDVGTSENWQNKTVKFTGTGNIEIIIQDYQFCVPTKHTVTISSTETINNVDRFSLVFPKTGAYMYRVGNLNEVPLNKLFSIIEGEEDAVGNICIEVESVTGASGENLENVNLSNDSIKFSGTGVVAVTITDDNYSEPLTLNLEVVKAENVTVATSATSKNIVLLNDVENASNIKITNGFNFYGNGFTLNYTGNGAYSSKDLKRGFIEIETGGQLDNTRVICKAFPEAYIYTTELSATPYAYQYSAVMITGSSRISNCYIYGARNNICIGAGNVTISDTITENGSLANIQIDKNATNDYTVTLNNVTTIQQLRSDDFGVGNKMLGVGVLVGTNESTSNPTLHLKGTFNQYNWVTEADAEVVTNATAKAIINAALGKSAYVHTINNVKSVNLGVIYLNELDAVQTNDTSLDYALDTVSMTISGANLTGQVYSILSTELDIVTDVDSADKDTVNGYYEPQFSFDDDLGGQYIEETTDCDEFCYVESGTVKIMFPEGETRILDLAGLVNIEKYGDQDLQQVITCKDSSGNTVAVTDGKITLSESMEYTVTYSVTDTVFVDKNGETVEQILNYAWDVPITVSLKDSGTPNAYFEFDTDKRVIYYNGNSITGYTQFIPFLAGLSIYDYADGSDTAYLRFNGSDTGDTGYGAISAVSINNVNTTGEAQGYHIVTVELTDGGKIVVDMDVRATSGGSTHSGSIKVADSVVYVVNDGTTSAKGQLWKIYSYKFVGNNGVEIDSGAITFGTDGTDATSKTKPTGTFGETSDDSSNTDPCVTPDTLITLADGSQKRIDQVTDTDRLLAWDFFKGEYTAVSPAIIFDHGIGNNTVIKLNFSDGTTVKVVNLHQFFDADLNEYVSIDAQTVSDYVGHRFIKKSGDSYGKVTLVDYSISQEYVEAWGIISAMHYNIIVEGMLSTDFMLEDYDLFNYFEVGDNLMFDEAKMQADIEKYGLYTYEEFAEYLTYEQFMAFNVPYFKVAVGKGNYTYAGILELIDTYLNN